MIYPATYDITILQNSTWSAALRVTEGRQGVDSIEVDAGVGTFNCSCHGYTAGDTVVVTGEAAEGTPLEVPCGLELNRVYYVIASGLTAHTFKLSATEGGAELGLSGTPSGVFYVATPIDLTGYTVDGDIHSGITREEEATMVCTVTEPVAGVVTLQLPPEVTVTLDPGVYSYDVSFTAFGGERYYFLKGTITVERTYSRN